MNFFIDSDKIKIYPTGKRAAEYGYLDITNTESNVVSLNKYLTHIDSYVISGMTLSVSGNTVTISAGKAIYKGYYVELLENVSITFTRQSGSTYLIYLKLNIQPTTISFKDYRNNVDNISLTIDELATRDNNGNFETPINYVKITTEEDAFNYPFPYNVDGVVLGKVAYNGTITQAVPLGKFEGLDVSINTTGVPSGILPQDITPKNVCEFMQNLILDDENV